MAAHKVRSGTTEEREYKTVKARFLAVNEARLERTREAMRPRQRDFLDLLPLLFHTNHPMLPGFVSKDAPAAVRGYIPDKPAISAAQRLARSFQFRKKAAVRRFGILGIYFMGSAGTVAYSDESDFDVWLCHDPGLDEEELALLQEKCTAIEQWADELDLEVHFFLINHEHFRSGQVTSLSEESSGSAQHSLLLDEFYRTGLLLAGNFPLWWLVPPDREADYETFAEEIKASRYRHTDDHIDFGGLAQIPAEEFFGAALWQLYKGIDAPYKSVLKLSLIEAYAAEYPEIELLSSRFKRAVHAGEDDLDLLDPYTGMLNKIEDHFSGRNEPERLELARRCFYFKVNMRLSETNVRTDMGEWQRRLLNRMTKDWGWSQSELVGMDGRGSWKINRVNEERRILFDALTASYRFLSDFARKYAGLALISQRDLNILGRKLYAAFERKAGKVDLLNRGINADLSESQITIQQIAGGERHGSWLLFRGLVKPDERGGITPLKRSRSVVELVTWCYFNGILGARTAVALYPRASMLGMGEFRTLVDTLRTLFPPDCLHARPMADFGKPARILQSVLLVNVGADPFMSVGRNSDQIAASGRTDPLRYGARGANLLVSIDQVLVSSWQEVLTSRFAGNRAVAQCLCEYLKWSLSAPGERPVPVAVRSVHTFRGVRIAERIEQLFVDVSACFFGERGSLHARYVLPVEDGYFVIHMDGDTPAYQHVEGYAGLLKFLCRPSAVFSPVTIDRAASAESLLRVMYERNLPGVVQLFYRSLGEVVEIHVLDERGSLYVQKMSFYDADTLISHFSRFFEAVLNRINLLMPEDQSLRPEGLEFHAVSRGRDGGIRVERQAPHYGRPDRQYLSLQVLVEVGEDGKTVFRLFCNGTEFSTLEYGADLFNAVVRYVLTLRKGGQRYPIYITDISMDASALGGAAAGRMQTVHFLSYKRRIEDKLNRSMEQIDAAV